MDPSNIDHQAAAVRDLLSAARSDEIRACVERGIVTLEWLARGKGVAKEMKRLKDEDPELFELLCELIGSGTRLDAIRRRVA